VLSGDPLVVGGALIKAGKLESGDLAYLISADLLVPGIATLIQSVGFWRFGARLPLMQNCAFAAVSPMIALGSEYGVTAVYGSVIACGLFTMLLAPIFSKLLRFFPPLVTGTVILIVGLSVMSVAAGWAGGGAGSPTFGNPRNLIFTLLTLVIILVIERFAPPAIQRLSILTGLIPRHRDLHPLRDVRSQWGRPTGLARGQHPVLFRLPHLRGERHHRDVHRGPGHRDRDGGRHYGGRGDRGQARQPQAVVRRSACRWVLCLIPKLGGIVEGIPQAVLGGAGWRCSAWSPPEAGGQARSRRLSPLARLAGRCTARRMAASDPSTRTRLEARVTAV